MEPFSRSNGTGGRSSDRGRVIVRRLSTWLPMDSIMIGLPIDMLTATAAASARPRWIQWCLASRVLGDRRQTRVQRDG
jgi:hypothetical protein